MKKLIDFFRELTLDNMTIKQSLQYWTGVVFIMVLMMPLAYVMSAAGIWYYVVYIILYMIFIWIVFGELEDSILRDS